MVDDETEAELREQFTEAFEEADFPVNNPMDLVPALPDGPGTRFEAGDVEFTAMELSTKLSGVQEFPYENVDELVDDLLAGLKEKDML
ncbi:MTH865 family protein [Halorussus halobius]|uniref:MTH865 family protein n=1 Tax=Halorussus halobius TaxID=1710537 RepID=UPI001092B1C2|nr:MTH865 family protein [Halorussus halobius]